MSLADYLAASQLPDSIGLAPENEDDLPFLRDLYASTRSEELAPVPWSEAQKRGFLDQQFHLQRQQYRQHYPGAEWLILQRSGNPIGRLYLHRGAQELRLMDLALMPEERGHGLGTSLMHCLMEWSTQQRLDLTLHVEPFNPAHRLYTRLGFHTERQTGIYHFMRRPSHGGDCAFTPG